MSMTIQPLVLTPKHHPAESLLGYTLRVSEKNGYDTPWHVMAHAGLSQGKMGSAGFPAEKLAAALARKASELEPISYCKVTESMGQEFSLLGHSLGQSLQYGPMRLTRPQFCPHCAQEKGFLEAFWDLTLVVACPEHCCTLVDSCPECGEKLKWFRPGILTCRCGANLANATTELVNDELVSMMAIMQAKLHGKPVDMIENTCGFPKHELNNLSLRSLLVLIDILGLHNLSSHGQDADDPMSIVQSAIEVLHNWPNGYREFLRRVGKRNEHSQKSVTGLRKHFEKLYYSLFKRRSPLVGIGFMRNEFVRFGLEEWGEGVVDNKLLRGEQIYKRFVSNFEQASRLGVRPITLRRWGEQGVVPMNMISTGKLKRYVVDSNAVSMKKAEGRTLGDRAAAAYVRLPVSVLKSLRNSRHYEVSHVPSRLKAFHENDLKLFSSLLSSKGVAVADIPAGSVSLCEVMRLKFRRDEGKADFIREMLSGRIEVIGRTSGSPADIMFSKNEVGQFLRDKRARAENDTWSLSEAAKYLHCDPVVLPTLIREGLLEIVNVPSGRRVTEQSVKNFEAKFVSVAKLAKQIGTSSRLLQRKIAKKNIPIKTFERGYGKADQPFVSREYDDHLSEIFVL